MAQPLDDAGGGGAFGAGGGAFLAIGAGGGGLPPGEQAQTASTAAPAALINPRRKIIWVRLQTRRSDLPKPHRGIVFPLTTRRLSGHGTLRKLSR